MKVVIVRRTLQQTSDLLLSGREVCVAEETRSFRVGGNRRYREVLARQAPDVTK